MIATVEDLLSDKYAVFQRWPGIYEDGILNGGGGGVGRLSWFDRRSNRRIELFVQWEYRSSSVASYGARIEAERAAIDACRDVPSGMQRYIVDDSLPPITPSYLTDMGPAPRLSPGDGMRLPTRLVSSGAVDGDGRAGGLVWRGFARAEEIVSPTLGVEGAHAHTVDLGAPVVSGLGIAAEEEGAGEDE